MAEVSKLLRAVPMFQRLDDQEARALESIVEVVGVLHGAVLFRRGDASDAFYVIARGRIEIQIDELTRIPLGEGEFFGEMGVMNSAPRTADAVALEDSVLLRVAKDDFDRVLTLDEAIAAKVMKTCLERGKSLAVVPFDTPSSREGELHLFYSPRGGAGTTTLAVNVACRLADLSGKRVGLVDADLQFGNCGMLLGASKPEVTFPELIARHGDAPIPDEELALVVESTARGIDLIRGPRKVEEAELVKPAHLVQAAEFLRRRTGMVVVDTPSALTDRVLALVDLASRVYLVIEPEIVAVTRASDCLRLFELAGVPSHRFHLVVNKVGKGGLPPEGIEKALRREIYANVARDIEAVAASIHDGVAVVDSRRSERVAVEIGNLARRILNPFDTALAAHAEAKKKAGFSLWNFLLGEAEPDPGKRVGA